MGKKKGSATGLGRQLIKDRFGGPKQRKFVADNSMLHTTEIQDGYDWGRLNLQSVTEESSFQEFLSTAELAGTEFQAEKLNIKFVNPRSNVGLLTKDEMKQKEAAHLKHKDIVKIPRRPAWDATTTVDQLQLNEKEAFLEWRRSLALLQEDQKLLLTPYEKNLEFWRQLWRVVERSDVVVQIVDARNPLLFRCEDLEKYVKEVSTDKENMILLNKADFMTDDQRQIWADYFAEQGIRVAFFSARLASEEINEKDKEESSEDENEESESSEGETAKKNISVEELKSAVQQLEEKVDKTAEKLTETLNKLKSTVGNQEISSNNETETSNDETETSNEPKTSLNSNKLLSREDLIELFRNFHHGAKVTEGVTTIGLVGYPNVGKSSTINALMTVKKVSVSATPGKTKHFQTLYLDKDILLCDCPGLVMPSFVFTKAEMVINGILPIDQMKDHVPPVNLVTNLIPRHVIEYLYGIMLPLPMEGEDEERAPTSEELLNAYGYNRGFMTANGQPDNPRSARFILKDYINGKLLFVHAPPGVKQEEFHSWPEQRKVVSERHVQPAREVRASKPNRMTTEDLDKMFFKTRHQGAHAKGERGKSTGLPTVLGSTAANAVNMEKPWKKLHKHENKKKKEKLRRVYRELDEH